MPKLLLPRRPDSLQGQRLADCVTTRKDHCLVVLAFDHSRFVWNEVLPCLFDDDNGEPNIFTSRMMTCLLEFASGHGRLWRVRADTLRSSSHSSPSSQDQQHDDSKKVALSAFYERYLPFPRRKRRMADHKCTILILPPIHDNIEYTWEERVILLEHDRIRAQSVAGFYSTLGGGYFMTRRLQTATALAREQQRIAVVLGNKEMYYKCTINQAYNHIYAGNFKRARQLIVQAWIALAHEKHFDEKVILQNMCYSAMLFRKRVRMASRQIPALINEASSRLVDDFSRIRVVEDQSSHDDLAVGPLARTTR